MGLGAIFPLHAQNVTKQKALNTAVSFFSNEHRTRRGAGQISPNDFTLAYTATDGNTSSLYVFNRSQGGFVVVSGDERTVKSVLAFSEEGEFDYDQLPPNAKYIIDSYSFQIFKLGSTGAKRTAATAASDFPESVSPLLGDIAWDQASPYNDYCPELDGVRCPTGCVATAMAQVMYYHKWPEHGTGSYSYYWALGGKTLSADFSQSVYRWDLMTPTYDSESSEEACDAVASLMSDCGIALNMTYDLGGSGASVERLKTAFVTYFDYDKSIKMLNRNNCSTDDWHNTLKGELAGGRPVIYSGANNGGHTFICDGYEDDLYFHFNFGWGGYRNMYCLTSATGFDSGQSIVYGIQRNCSGKPQLVTQQTSDFVYEDGKLTTRLEYHFLDAIEGLVVEGAIAVENVSSKSVDYYNIQTKPYLREGSVSDVTEELTGDIADGDYIVYVVSRFAGDEEWNKAFATEYRQTFVDLNVTDGIKTFSNNNLYDDIRDGVTEIDGVYYILDGNEAIVTYKNDNKNSYIGDIVIPETVTYSGKTYEVTAVGESAFEKEPKLYSVKLPSSIIEIRQGAFSQSSVEQVLLPSDSKLKTLGGWAFNGCSNMYKFDLPNNLKSIGMCAYQLSLIQTAVFPESCTDFSYQAFNAAKLESVFVNYKSAPIIWDKTFDDYYPPTTLYVPIGTKEQYANVAGWNKIETIVEYSTVVSDGISYAYCPDENYATVYNSDKDNIPSELKFPKYIKYDGKSIPLTRIEGGLFYRNEKLEKIDIPENVDYIGRNAFANCVGLKEVWLHSAEPVEFFYFDTLFDGVNLSECTLYVPKGSLESYRYAALWAEFGNIKEYNDNSDEENSELDGIETTTVDKDCTPKVYTLDGKQLNTTITANLPNGIYIVNGKKVVVK